MIGQKARGNIHRKISHRSFAILFRSVAIMTLPESASTASISDTMPTCQRKRGKSDQCFIATSLRWSPKTHTPPIEGRVSYRDRATVGMATARGARPNAVTICVRIAIVERDLLRFTPSGVRYTTRVNPRPRQSMFKPSIHILLLVSDRAFYTTLMIVGVLHRSTQICTDVRCSAWYYTDLGKNTPLSVLGYYILIL